MCVLIYSFQMLIMKYIYVTCLEFNQILYREHQNKKYIKDKLASIHWIVFSNQMGENIFDPIISGLGSKGGVSSPFFPKIQALPGWGGRSDPCLDFFEGFVHMNWGPSKVIIYHQKLIFPHKSVPYSPEKIIQPHLFYIFTLESQLRTSMGQIA